MVETYPGGQLSEAFEIDDVERADVVRTTAEGFAPIPRLPKSETFHFGPVIAHGRVSIDVSLKIKVDELLHVGPDNLVCTISTYCESIKDGGD